MISPKKNEPTLIPIIGICWLRWPKSRGVEGVHTNSTCDVSTQILIAIELNNKQEYK